jgi:hypothetical protein
MNIISFGAEVTLVVKGKANTADCERPRIPHFLDKRPRDVPEVFSLTRLTLRLEGLDQLTKSSDLIGIRNRNLPACSTVPQPATLLHVPYTAFNIT